MLDRAEQRSKHLGIANTQKIPLNEVNQQDGRSPPSSSSSSGVKRQNTRRKSAASPQKQKNTLTMTRNVGTPSKRRDDEEAKENLDVALEINITAGHNVQVISFIITFILCTTI